MVILFLQLQKYLVCTVAFGKSIIDVAGVGTKVFTVGERGQKQRIQGKEEAHWFLEVSVICLYACTQASL